MKWLLGFLAGAVCGAAAMYFYLPGGAGAPVPMPAPVGQPAVIVPAPVTPGGDSAAQLSATSTTTAPAMPLQAPAAGIQPAPPGADTPAPGTAAMSQSGTQATAVHPAKLAIPVAGYAPQSLQDMFDQPRGDRKHGGIDLLAAKGTEVRAVADGRIAKLFDSKEGGLTIYQFDPAEKFSYYYAHLDRYAPGVAEGKAVKRGELIGYVGVTGNADPKAPHLHFAVFELPPEKQWWKGTPINPYPLLKP